MKGIERLSEVDRSTPLMAQAIPELDIPGAVMVRLLNIAAFGLHNFFEPVFRELGLTEKTYHILCLLQGSENGTASPGELSEMLGTSRANITRLLEDLKGDGFISRSVDSRDARRHVISITAAGRRKALDVAPKLAEPIRNAFSDLDDKQFDLLQTLLRTLIVSLDKSPRIAAESAGVAA